MNLHEQTSDVIDNLGLPEEALAALRDGVEWEYEPMSVEGTQEEANRDGDHWFLTWTVFGLRIDAKGTLYETEWSVDTGGNWDWSDEHPYGTYDHAAAYAAVRQGWREYAAHVAQTGDDPLCNYFVSGSRDERWQFRATDSIVGIKIVVRRNSRGAWLRLSDTPEYVQTYFEGIETFKNVADLRTCGYVERWKRNGTGVVRLKAPRSPATIKRQLITLARKHMEAA